MKVLFVYDEKLNFRKDVLNYRPEGTLLKFIENGNIFFCSKGFNGYFYGFKEFLDLLCKEGVKKGIGTYEELQEKYGERLYTTSAFATCSFKQRINDRFFDTNLQKGYDIEEPIPFGYGTIDNFWKLVPSLIEYYKSIGIEINPSDIYAIDSTEENKKYMERYIEPLGCHCYIGNPNEVIDLLKDKLTSPVPEWQVPEQKLGWKTSVKEVVDVMALDVYDTIIDHVGGYITEEDEEKNIKAINEYLSGGNILALVSNIHGLNECNFAKGTGLDRVLSKIDEKYYSQIFIVTCPGDCIKRFRSLDKDYSDYQKIEDYFFDNKKYADRFESTNLSRSDAHLVENIPIYPDSKTGGIQRLLQYLLDNGYDIGNIYGIGDSFVNDGQMIAYIKDHGGEGWLICGEKERRKQMIIDVINYVFEKYKNVYNESYKPYIWNADEHKKTVKEITDFFGECLSPENSHISYINRGPLHAHCRFNEPNNKGFDGHNTSGNDASITPVMALALLPLVDESYPVLWKCMRDRVLPKVNKELIK